jgi:hypothetical protein
MPLKLVDLDIHGLGIIERGCHEISSGMMGGFDEDPG